MDLFVARQPILDRRMNVVAYEMLYRSSQENTFDGTDEDTATSKVINALFYSPEGEAIRGGRPAFVNFPRNLLLRQAASVLPPNDSVIEILETVTPDAAIIAACRELRSRSYRLALDDFVLTDNHPLVPLVDYIKVDIRATPLDQQRAIIERYRGGPCLLAEKVETQKEFQEAAEMGFSCFQGYFFARPVVSLAHAIPGHKLNYLRLLQAIHRTELDFDVLSGLIKREPGLSYKLLRFVNSAWFGTRAEIKSIDQAVRLMGEIRIRNWLSVTAIIDLSADKPHALVINALVRARFAELLALQACGHLSSDDLFLIGLFSRLDAVLGRPLNEILESLHLREEIRNTLVEISHPKNSLYPIWELLLAYESANWNRVTELAADQKIDSKTMPDLYSAAVKWANSLSEA